MSRGASRSSHLPALAAALLVASAAGLLAGGNSPAARASSEWPPSADLLVSEIVTGGVSANDEFVELYNAGSLPVDLGGLELVYVTATGSSITRKVSWSSGTFPSHHHRLIANSAGVFASLADDTYSGGVASTGGSIALRVVNGGVIDAVSWGTAANAFAEGSAAPAPPQGQSIERLPGGDAGNGHDDNDNASDWWVNDLPIADSLSAPAVPAPTPTAAATPTPNPTPTLAATLTPSPTPTAAPTVAPTPTPTAITSATASATPSATASAGQPTASPTAMATPGPTPSSTPTATPSGTPAPTPSPTATHTATPAASPTPTSVTTPPPTPTPTPSPTPTQTPGPTPTPTPSPSPTAAPIPISDARSRSIGASVTVSGTVTVEPGRILGDSVIAIEDATGGICVSLPSDVTAETFVRGSVVRVTGVLAAPYANLELRPHSGTDVAVTGVALDPTPLELTSATLNESTEGELASVSGTLDRIDPSSSGSLALTLVTSSGDARVFFHAPLGASRDAFDVGGTYRALGIVGQRESAKGLNDGYRLWPRAIEDVTLVSPAPTDTPTPTATPGPSRSPHGSPSPGPTATPRPTKTPKPTATARPTATPSPRATGTPGPSRAPLITIAAALRRPGETVRVQGTVTSRPGFLDADARRVTLESHGAAILLRLPEDVTAPGLGSKVDVSGEVGTYYGAPQLAADDPPERMRGGAAPPTVLRRAPDASDEWRLVRVTVRIENVAKSGDTWRAEASLGAGGSLPIAGLAASGIPSTALVEGRSATITGIVKRAYPTASDQRFAIAPRSAADVQLGAEPKPSSSPGDGQDPAGNSDDTPPPWNPDATDAPWLATSGDPQPGASSDPQDPGGVPLGAGSAAEPVDTTVDGLPALVGSRVRIAGRVQSPSADGFSLVDATGEISVRMLAPGSLDPLRLLPDEIVNVVGWDSQRDIGDLEVVVVAAQDVVRGPRLSAGSAPPGVGPTGAGAASSSDPEPQPAVPSTTGPSGIAVVALVVLLAALAAAIGFGVLAYRSWRRRRA